MFGINVQEVLNRYFNIEVVKYLPRAFDKWLLKDDGKKDLVGIEIGVYLGEHSVYLMRSRKVKFMYLIDEYDLHNDTGHSVVDSGWAEERVGNNIKHFRHKCEQIKENSDVAHKRFDKGSVDFVYIDGGHSYEQVKKDIENYYLLVKSGGIIGGHDFNNGNAEDYGKDINQGVVKAVLEFIKDNGYEMDLFVNHHDWWVVKR
jgi:hypothetical protein